jgi:hypothetical protein
MNKLGLLLATLISVFAHNAEAHKFSTAYLDVSERGGQPLIVWQVALHDLAQANLLNGANGNAVSWQQVLDSETTLINYITAQIAFTADATPCTLAPQSSDNWLLQQIQGDFYLQLAVQADCASTQNWQLKYKALFDIEHSHKALLFWHLANDRRRAVLDASSALFPAD